jgi:hypothetical protein
LILASPWHKSLLAAENGPNQAAFCRAAEYDAANCLYLQLRLLGFQDNYDAFRAQLPADPASLTLKEMAAIARRLGFRHEPVKMTVSELVRAQSPVILHFESHGVNSGEFMLFLWMYNDETKVALIDGAHVTFKEMARDEFRRSWTGYALIGRPPFHWDVWIRRSAATLACAGLCSWLTIRLGSRVNRSNASRRLLPHEMTS